MTEILRFEMNVPSEVALKYAGPGKSVEGRFGNRVMYTLADNRVMYVAPIVASQISKLGIQPGERFQVCKLEKREGRRKLIEWQVQRLLSEPETQLEQRLRESIAAAQSAKGAQPREATAELTQQPPPPVPEQKDIVLQISVPTPGPSSMTNGASNGTASAATRNGNGQPARAAKPEHPRVTATSADDASVNSGCTQEYAMPPAPASTPAVVAISNGSVSGAPSAAPKNGNNPPPVTTKLEHALKTAISAAHSAEKYGAELGYVVRFDADAIKSMAITVLINMSEGGRR